MQFGTDGIRGPYGSVITPELAFSLGYATTRVLSQISPAAEPMINIEPPVPAQNAINSQMKLSGG